MQAGPSFRLMQAILTLLLAMPAAGMAQEAKKPVPPKPETLPAEVPPPYEPQLLRLAEILGALSYLQDICGTPGADTWRTRMTALLDAEAKTPARRERYAGAFNKGFRGYELSYRTCTPNAQAVIARFLDEGGRIARLVANRYGTS